MRHHRCSRFRGDRRVGGRGCRGCCRQFRRRLRSFFYGGRLGFYSTLQLVANLLRNLQRNGTGVGLLFGNAKTRQKVNDGFRLDLQFAGQFVNSDLG